MKVVYIDMVGDLFHYGHVFALQQCKEMGDYLVVGVHNDEDVKSYKREPVMNMEQRMNVIQGCRYVDEVIGNAPLTITNNFLESNEIDVVCITDNRSEEQNKQFYGNIMDKVVTFKYTSEISTTTIIDNIRTRITNKTL